ncbi:MAG TPA: hypothetical protein VKC56_07230 [Gallionellaceae bacterium]|nr:hypothetical protein [Gallionellaceae bacterium]
MSWVMVRFSSADIIRGQDQRLAEQFKAVWVTAHAPKDAAMFGSKDTAGGNHVFYFSPRAAEIFFLLLSRYWSPMECPAPSRQSVALMVGHHDASDMLT